MMLPFSCNEGSLKGILSSGTFLTTSADIILHTCALFVLRLTKACSNHLGFYLGTFALPIVVYYFFQLQIF